MNRLLVITCIMVFAAAALLAGGHPMNTNQVTQPTPGSRDDVIYWEEDFEEGQGDWIFLDETAPTEAWHLSTEGAYDGNSWWMGNEAIGGYTNHRYIVLDTPSITLPAGTPELSFMMSYLMEDVGGTDPYNGWDGFNVRVCPSGSDVWTPIEGTPAYTETSFYSFGFEFGEGAGIPAYGGDSDGWISATFDLSTYAGQEVQIRFAFASDPSACTDDGNGSPDWFGVRIDDINVADVFESDGDGAAGDSQMIPGTLNETAGNFWEMSTAMAHSGENSVHLSVQNDLLNSIISPVVSIPDLEEVYFSYWVYCDMLDSDGNDDNSLEDYYLVYVRPVGETSWTRLHYLFNGGTTGGVYSEWTYIDQEFCTLTLAYQEPAGTADITEFAGDDVQFRFVVTTDDNDDGGVGDGLFLDDMYVYSPVFLPIPANFTAEVTEDFDVQLDWDNPMAGGGEGWINWDDGENDDGVGTGAAADIFVAARFDANDLLPYIGSSITNVKFFPRESACDYTIMIWDSGTTVLLEQDVTAPTMDQWNDITLDNPLEIGLGDELWIGYEANTTTGHPCGVDAGPSIPGKGSWIKQGTGAWNELPDISDPPVDKNWNIQAYVTAPEGARPLTRDLTGYKVYRTTESGTYDTPLAEISDPAETEFLDNDPTAFAVNYYVVTAVYDEGESSMTTEEMAFVLANSAATYSYDDGAADDGFAPGSGVLAATYFDGSVHPSVGHVTLEYAMFYFTAVSDWDAIVKVWDNDGTDGMPGTEMATFLFDNEMIAVNDWTYIDIADNPEFDDGDFYIGLQGVPSSVTIGVDDSVDGWSYNTAGDDWAAVEGTYMIRAIVDRGTGISEEVLPTDRLAAANFPNPFNPTTTISYNLPEAGMVDLKIYNVRGQLVTTLMNEHMEAGQHDIVWEGKNATGQTCSSGLYFFRVNTENGSFTKKMMLLK